MNGLQYRMLLVIASRRVEELVSLKSVSLMRKDFVQLPLARFRPITISISIFQRFIRVLPPFSALDLTKLPVITRLKVLSQVRRLRSFGCGFVSYLRPI
jgi:hypothetical protein